MADNDPLEEQVPAAKPLGGQPPDDPNATQAEPDEPVVLPAEPATAEEGVEEATSEVTQEAPLLGELPAEPAPVPQVPAFPIDVKPRSDIYTLMLILSFITFVAVAILAGKEAYDYYDVQFYVFSKENTLTRKQEEAPPPDAGPTPTPAPAPSPGGGGGN